MLDKVHTYIDSNFQKHLNRAQEFLRLPSISVNHLGLSETALWLKNQLEFIGGKVQFIGKSNAPIIIAEFELGKPRTLLVYGMYDVQPTDGQNWSSPPFDANILNLPKIGPSIIARGACNSKGPLIGFLNTIEAIKTVDNIPINLILTIEGEEEIGSPTLPEFYHQNREWLKSKADGGFEPFWADYGTDVDTPIMSLGSKGILSIELICRGGEWGGPTVDSLHSSVGAWISSPVWRLVKAVNLFLDNYENILIKDFAEEVIPLSPEDEKLLVELSRTFNEKQTLKIMGAERFKYQEKGVDLLRRYFFLPSIQLGTLTHAEGDVITPEAHFQLSIRLVPNMDPLRTTEKIKHHLVKFGYSDIEVKIIAHYPCSRTSLHETIVQNMLETYREFGVQPQIWPLLAGATPYYLFSEILRLPYTWGGLGKAGKSHVADEYATVDGLKLFEKSIATFLYKFAQK